MDPNPYLSPESSASCTLSLQQARRKVTGPSIGMIVLSVVGLLYCCGFIVWAILVGAEDSEIASDDTFKLLMRVAPVVATTVYMAMLFGAVQMLRCKSYAWAMAASILALTPCSLFTALSVVFGVWGILVLRNQQVRAIFR